MLGGAVALLAAALAFTPFESHDLWWHLRAGEWIRAQGRTPTTNLFSFTAPDHPWIPHEWLSEVLFYGLYRRLGPDALVWLKVLLLTAAFTLAWWVGRREADAWSAALIVAVAAYAARLTFDIRPQLFTYLCLAITWALLDHHHRRGGRAIYALAPLICLWANLHSGFITGLGLLALAAATMPQRRGSLLKALGLCVLAALLTPYHWRGFWFPFAVSRTKLFTDTLTEWFSPNFHSSWLWGFEALLLGTLLVLAVSPIRPRAFDWIALLVFAHLALQHQRHIPLFALAATPVAARHLSALAKPWAAVVSAEVQVVAAAGLLLAAWITFLGALPARPRFATTVQQRTFPVAAARFLARRPPGRMYNSYRWGGYLVWRLYSRGHRVFIDGRADAYPHRVFEEYLAVERLQAGWEAILDRHRIDTVVYHHGGNLSLALRQSGRWRLAHSDGVADVFTRATPRSP